MAKNSQTTAQARPGSVAQKKKPQRSSHGRATPELALRRAAPAPSHASPRPDGAAAAADFTFYVNPTVALICLPAQEPARFPLEFAADLTGVHPEMLRYYCRVGLLGADRSDGDREPTFDPAALQEVRRIEHYRRHLAVSRQALPLVCKLRREAESQHIEIHFLHCP